MVKIRLRRSGSKHRPFYRVVVAKSTSGRDGAFIEIIGTYNPVLQPKLINIKEDRALHWLMNGAQPSETAAIIMHRAGILEKYFEQRPTAKKQFKFLDKRTASMSVKSVISSPSAEKPPKPEAPVAEPAAAPETMESTVEAEAPVIEESPVEVAVEVANDSEAEATVETESAAPVAETVEPETNDVAVEATTATEESQS